YDTIDYDPNSNFNTGTYTYTAPVSGRYAINAGMQIALLTGTLDLRVKVNGTAITAVGSNYTSATKSQCILPTVLRLNSGDTVTMETLQNSGGSVNVNGGQTTGTYLAISCTGPQ
ncbi:MAG: hypothetical protein M3O28_00830, partial [Actinomycetota bacterium]|nr:hypothetical protein [Actinomycetota bacterium]